jgi:hypothetical protein
MIIREVPTKNNIWESEADRPGPPQRHSSA